MKKKSPFSLSHCNYPDRCLSVRLCSRRSLVEAALASTGSASEKLMVTSHSHPSGMLFG